MAITEPAPLCCTPLSKAPMSEDEASSVADVLKVIADPVRLRIVSIVASSGEVCACDLPALLDRSQPTISHHLSQLVNAGLLEREKRGKWAWFRLHQARLNEICAILC